MACAFASAASAQTASDNLSVSATVADSCTITTSPLAFGAYDPVSANASTALDGSGAVNVTCTKGSTGITVTLGLGANASGAIRRMTDGTDFLAYELYHPSATTPSAGCTFPGTQVWGTAGGAIFTPTGVTWDATVAQVFNVCGTVPAAQNVGAGTYNDTVVATVNF